MGRFSRGLNLHPIRQVMQSGFLDLFSKDDGRKRWLLKLQFQFRTTSICSSFIGIMLGGDSVDGSSRLYAKIRKASHSCECPGAPLPLRVAPA